jgi:GNAT superfamily N-acetyltransferase
VQSADELLAAYDAQVRARVPARLPVGVEVTRDGPLVRFAGPAGGGFVVYRDLDGLEGAELDALIERQVRMFSERGERFEWKHHGHDLPADLPDRLRAAGFVAEESETIVIGRAADVGGEPEPPEGVSLRETTERADLERIEELEREVWQEDGPGRIADMLEGELDADADGLAVVLAEAREKLVSAAWIRFEHGTEFATLWGGATLAEWRRQGIYRALVAYRAGLAVERGFRFLEVDASDDSRPILERLGFVPTAVTTPFVWSPGGSHRPVAAR